MDHDRAKRAIVQVGKNGRGFMCGGLIVTAASCLPRFPAFKPFDSNHVQVYPNILGRLGETPSISAQCEFADAISNVALLAELPPDDYGPSLTDLEISFPVRRPARECVGAPIYQSVWIFTVDGQWRKCLAVMYDRDYLRIFEEENDDPIKVKLEGRMSGSPVVDEEGAAIGILSIPIKEADRNTWVDEHPVLARCLPGMCLN